MLTCRIVLQTEETRRNRQVDDLLDLLARVKIKLMYHKLKGALPAWEVVDDRLPISRAIVTFADEDRIPAGFIQSGLEDGVRGPTRMPVETKCTSAV